MQVFRYSIAKLLLMIVAGVAIWFFGDWLTDNFVRKRWFAGVIFMCLAPFMIGTSILRLMNRDALRLEPGRIAWAGWFGERSAHISELVGARVETAGRTRHLKLDFGRGLLGNCNISELLLERKAGKIEEILAAVERYAAQEIARASGDYGDPALDGPPVRSRRARAPAAPAAAPVAGGFGRKGL